jgi:hypothetical protein
MTRGSGRARLAIVRVGVLSWLILPAACGTPRITLPSGAGTPFPDAIPGYADAVRECRGARTLTASLNLSGRAGSSKLSARVDAGFAEPGRLRLEGYPRINFGGKPFFILVATGRDATLVLTRDNRVLGGAAPAAIIEALTGIALEPDEMRALMTGCAIDNDEATDGRSFGQGWTSVQTGKTTVFLRPIENRPRVAALRRGSLVVEYADFTGGQPATVHLHTTASANVAAADLTIRISQREVNVPLENAVFSVEVPKDAVPLTLEELRRAGPLGGGEAEAAAGTEEESTERIFFSVRPPVLRSFVVIGDRSLRLLRSHA